MRLQYVVVGYLIRYNIAVFVGIQFIRYKIAQYVFS